MPTSFTSKYRIKKAKVHPWYSIGACVAFWLGCAVSILSTFLLARMVIDEGMLYALSIYIFGLFIITPSTMILFRAAVTIFMRLRHKNPSFWIVLDPGGRICNIFPIYRNYNQDPRAVLTSYIRRYSEDEINKHKEIYHRKFACAIIRYE